jgi:hypothetical protein
MDSAVERLRFDDCLKEAPKPYPPEFRRRALDLVASGRSVRDAQDGGVGQVELVVEAVAVSL